MKKPVLIMFIVMLSATSLFSLQESSDYKSNLKVPEAFETKEYLFRCPTLEDAPKLLASVQELKGDMVTGIKSSEDVAQVILKSRETFQTKQEFRFNVFEQKTKAFVGTIVLIPNWGAQSFSIDGFTVKSENKCEQQARVVGDIVKFAFTDLLAKSLEIECCCCNNVKIYVACSLDFAAHSKQRGKCDRSQEIMDDHTLVYRKECNS